MRKRDNLFQNFCSCQDLIQKSIIHDELERFANIATYET